jgi:hypothetical protein
MLTVAVGTFVALSVCWVLDGFTTRALADQWARVTEIDAMIERAAKRTHKGHSQ